MSAQQRDVERSCFTVGPPHQITVSTVHRSDLITLITKAIDTSSISYHAAGGETPPVFHLQKR